MSDLKYKKFISSDNFELFDDYLDLFLEKFDSSENGIENFILKSFSDPDFWKYSSNSFDYFKELYKFIPENREQKVLWQQGSTKLIEYSSCGDKLDEENSSVVLFIPSLINRSCILDLSEDNSMLNFIAGQGIKVLLVDWQEPESDELSFSIENYVTRLSLILDFVYNYYGKKITLCGYCAGGILSLILAQLELSNKIKSLVFIATPWNFDTGQNTKYRPYLYNTEQVRKFIYSFDKIPSGLIQLFFSCVYYELIYKKMKYFDSIKNNLQLIRKFLEVEKWVNNGISLTNSVAETFFLDWSYHNKLYNGNWSLFGEVIDPCKISIPSLFIIPKKDKIVPEESSVPLYEKFNEADIIKIDSGHIGMIVGRNARENLWEPLCSRLKAN